MKTKLFFLVPLLSLFCSKPNQIPRFHEIQAKRKASNSILYGLLLTIQKKL